VVVEVVDTPEEAIAAGKSHDVRPYVSDSRREYLQGIRDGAEGSRRNRQCKFTDGQPTSFTDRWAESATAVGAAQDHAALMISAT
jgi:ribosome modulation factor